MLGAPTNEFIITLPSQVVTIQPYCAMSLNIIQFRLIIREHTMATAINVSVDETLKKEATDLYTDLGLTVQEAIRIFLRRSVRMRGMPFPMNQISQMDMADAEIRHYLTTGKGLKTFKTSKEAFDALDQL